MPAKSPTRRRSGWTARRSTPSIDGLAQLGLNSVRLQFSNAMLHDTRPVPRSAANPDLHGLTPLQVYDPSSTG